jgi:hypothetical protein
LESVISISMRPDAMYVDRADAVVSIEAEMGVVLVLDGWNDVDWCLMVRD